MENSKIAVDLENIINNESCIKKKFIYEKIIFNCSSDSQNVFDYISEYWHDDNIEDNNFEFKNYYLVHVENKTYINEYFEQLMKLKIQKSFLIHKSGMIVSLYYFKKMKVFLCKNEELLIINRKEKEFVIFTKNKGGSYVLRIIREIIFREMENRGSLIFHGAAIDYNGFGIYICGKKSAGKTTTMLKFLKRGFNFIANDRVFINDNNELFSLNYIPLAIRIGYGTVRSEIVLENYINNKILSRKQKNWKEEEAKKIGSSIKVELTPKELCEGYQVKKKSIAILKCVIIPSFEKDMKDFIIEKLDIRDAKKELKEACMTPNDDNWLTPWLISRKLSDDKLFKISNKKIDLLVKKCNFYKVYFGENSTFIDSILNIILSKEGKI